MRRTFVAAFTMLTMAAGITSGRAQGLSNDGGGCEAAIGRWQDFATRESQGGHMDDSVYSMIKTEIEQATEVCQAGQDERATKMVEASMRRHGY